MYQRRHGPVRGDTTGTGGGRSDGVEGHGTGVGSPTARQVGGAPRRDRRRDRQAPAAAARGEWVAAGGGGGGEGGDRRRSPRLGAIDGGFGGECVGGVPNRRQRQGLAPVR